MDENYFIEDLSSSEDEENNFRSSTWFRDDSPPAVLTFPFTSAGDTVKDLGLLCGVDAEQERGSSEDEAVEEWMILKEDPEEGDSTIHLNLSFSISSDTSHEDEKVTLSPDEWTVSKRDKESGEIFSICRYFTSDQSLFCPVCKKTGHLAKSCQLKKKYPVCVLCGIQGHLQKDCLHQPCSRCGLLLHGSKACDQLPVWNQHCQRCGLMGHFSEICPDTWRQYHHTITMKENPIPTHAVQKKKRPSYCYNCSRRGHYGHECSLKRMSSGTFLTLPYVCHYDTSEKALETRTQNRNMEVEDKDTLSQRRTKMKQKTHASGSKTWPERRRERQEVKRLRREAQARRGGFMGHCQSKSDNEDILYLEYFGGRNPWKYTSPSNKANKTLHHRNKNSRKTQKEHLKRRSRKNPDCLYSLKELDIGCKDLPPKQRVRHSRR